MELLLGPLIVIAVVALVLLIVPRLAKATAYPEFLGDLAPSDVNSPVRLRFATAADEPFLLTLAGDAAAAAANGWTGDEASAVQRRFAQADLFEALARRELIAVDASTGEPVGTTMVMPSPYGKPGGRSIGVQVHPDKQRQGLGRHIVKAAIANLQQSPAPLFVGTATTNRGMQQVMANLGYTPDPGTHQYRAPNGSQVDALWYDCTR